MVSKTSTLIIKIETNMIMINGENVLSNRSNMSDIDGLRLVVLDSSGSVVEKLPLEEEFD